MEDSAIVELYWSRSENAVPETSRKYGKYCFAVANNILASNEDSDEAVNDTWLGAWKSMPENRPSLLAPYLAKITRNISISRLREKNRLKRGGGSAAASLEELSETLDAGISVEKEIERKELAEKINTFLSRLGDQERRIFMARYWYMASVEEIAEKFGFSQSKVKMTLMRSREKLKKYLKGEGLC